MWEVRLIYKRQVAALKQCSFEIAALNNIQQEYISLCVRSGRSVSPWSRWKRSSSRCRGRGGACDDGGRTRLRACGLCSPHRLHRLRPRRRCRPCCSGASRLCCWTPPSKPRGGLCCRTCRLVRFSSTCSTWTPNQMISENTRLNLISFMAVGP